MTILPKKKQPNSSVAKSQSQQEARQRLRFDSQAGSSSRHNFDENSGPPPTRRQRLNNPSPCSSPPRSVSQASVRNNAGKASGSGSRVSSHHNSPINSEDEYEALEEDVNEESSEDIERRFEEMMKKKGFNVKKMDGDGACLFRAVADQIYGDQDMHGTVRLLCMDYMEKNRDYFSGFITEDFNEYIRRKRADHVHGNHVEMQAMVEVFSRPIQVFQYSSEPINLFQSQATAANPPIRVSYHGGVHYNSIVDPFAATIGVGLGLPSFHPGSADKSLVQDAVKASDTDDIERAMLEDKLRATDREATEEKIDEQVARDSYLQWIREQELKLKENAPCHSRTLPSAGGSSDRGQQSPHGSRSSKPSSPAGRRSRPQSPQSEKVKPDEDAACGSGTASGNGNTSVPTETASIMNQIPPSLFGLEDWGHENDILQKILALSQQEYLESLKKQHHSPDQ